MPMTTGALIVLSETAGQRIANIRRRRNLNRAELAARCTAFGLSISADQIANIETGRPRKGARTREVTLDELAVIARALGTSPMRLVFAVGEDDTTEVAGTQVDTYEAARWWRGYDPFPGLEWTAEVLHDWSSPKDAKPSSTSSSVRSLPCFVTGAARPIMSRVPTGLRCRPRTCFRASTITTRRSRTSCRTGRAIPADWLSLIHISEPTRPY